MRYFALSALIVLLVASSTSAGSVSWKTRGSEECTTWEFSFKWSSAKSYSDEDECEEDESHDNYENNSEDCADLLRLLSKLRDKLKWLNCESREEECEEEREMEDCEEYQEEECEEYEEEECEEQEYEECEEQQWNEEDCEEYEEEECEENEPIPARTSSSESSNRWSQKSASRRNWSHGNYDNEEDCDEDTNPIPAAAAASTAAVESAPEPEANAAAEIPSESAIVPVVQSTESLAAVIESVQIEPTDELALAVVAPESIAEVVAESIVPVETPTETVAEVAPVVTVATPVISAVPEPSGVLLSLVGLSLAALRRSR